MGEHLGPEPTPDPETGVPFCSGDECGRYDGKRCWLTGNRPSGICEPAVAEMIVELRRLRGES